MSFNFVSQMPSYEVYTFCQKSIVHTLSTKSTFLDRQHHLGVHSFCVQVHILGAQVHNFGHAAPSSGVHSFQ